MGHEGRPEDRQQNLFRSKGEEEQRRSKAKEKLCFCHQSSVPHPLPRVSPSVERSTKGKARSDLSCSHRVRTAR